MSSSTAAVPEEDEEVEVRSLLKRHSERIAIDLEQSDLLPVLVKKNVISAIAEEVINKAAALAADNQQQQHHRKCELLIELIAKSGFKKFKEFCYAIEEECPLLISQMINDHTEYCAKNGTTTIN